MPGSADLGSTDPINLYGGYEAGGQVEQGLQIESSVNPTDTIDKLQQMLRPVRDWLGPGMVESEMFNAGLDPRLLKQSNVMTAEQLNQQYGVPGYLKFDQAETQEDAELDNEMARKKQWHDYVWSRTDHSLLGDVFASTVGAMTDPANDLLAFSGIGEGLYGLAFGEKAAAAALEGAGMEGLEQTPKLWNGLLPTMGKAVAGQMPFVAKDLALDYGTGHPDDFDMGSELASVAGFAILHAGLHTAGNALGVMASRAKPPPAASEGVPGEAAPRVSPSLAGGSEWAEFTSARGFTGEEPTSATPSGFRPPEVDMADTPTRGGAFIGAVDEVRQGEDVTVGQKLVAALQRPGVEQLDEAEGAGAPPSWRPAPPGLAPHAIAVTARGSEVPVQYGVVEASDLVARHDTAGLMNPAYPDALQPRDARAPAPAAPLTDAAGLMGSGLADAARGAPIIGRDGLVEAGGGTVAALQRAAALRSPEYTQYVEALSKAGYPVEGMQAPVLVRMRGDPMSGAGRAVLADEMSPDAQPLNEEEQGLADARRIGDDELDALTGQDDGVRRGAERALARRLAPDETLVDQNGRLTQGGARRLSTAIMAKAYGDHDVLAAINSGDLKGLGAAMRAAAPAWARMKAAITRGDVPKALDLTVHLNSAALLTKAAVDAGKTVGEYLATVMEGEPMISGGMLAPETEGILRNFYQNEGMGRPTAEVKLTGVLRDYAQWALPEGAEALARRAEPGMFAKLDELAGEMETHRGTLRELGEARRTSPDAVQAGADIDRILEPVRGVESRLTKAAAARLEEARGRLEQALHADTPEMADARSRLMQADYAHREMAGAVSRALREADTSTAEGSAFLRGYAEWARTQEIPRGQDTYVDAGSASRRALYLQEAHGWDGRAGIERAPGGTEGPGRAAGGLGPGYSQPGVEGGEPRGGGVPAEGGLGAEGGGRPEPRPGGRPDVERPGVAGEGGAEPAVSGDAGREPGGEGQAAAGGGAAAAARLIKEDPVLTDFQQQLEAATRKTGIAAKFEKDPSVLAEAARAAAVCMKGEL